MDWHDGNRLRNACTEMQIGVSVKVNKLLGSISDERVHAFQDKTFQKGIFRAFS